MQKVRPMTNIAMTHDSPRGEPTRLFYLDGSRRLAEAASPDSRVGLLYVVFMTRGRAPRFGWRRWRRRCAPLVAAVTAPLSR